MLDEDCEVEGMKLTGELKDKVESAETMDAKKDIIAEAGMELTDEELDGVAGGVVDLYQTSSNPILQRDFGYAPPKPTR